MTNLSDPTPYLIEAIKSREEQIESLQQQLNEVASERLEKHAAEKKESNQRYNNEKAFKHFMRNLFKIEDMQKVKVHINYQSDVFSLSLQSALKFLGDGDHDAFQLLKCSNGKKDTRIPYYVFEKIIQEGEYSIKKIDISAKEE